MKNFLKEKVNNIMKHQNNGFYSKKINKDKKIRFFKTHSFLGNYQGKNQSIFHQKLHLVQFI